MRRPLRVQDRNRLVERYMALIRKTIRRIQATGVIPTYVEIDDIVQEAAVRLLGALGEYKVRLGATVGTFIRRVVHDDALGVIRRERFRRSARSGLEPYQRSAERPGLDMADAERVLTEQQCAVLFYCHELGYSQTEVAAMMGLSQPSVSRLLAGACRNLQKA